MDWDGYKVDANKQEIIRLRSCWEIEDMDTMCAGLAYTLARMYGNDRFQDICIQYAHCVSVHVHYTMSN